ncbi:MAG: PTS sugar transporter subunit IIA [Phycisphaerales bacterium]|nr:MAG: PTS sugar transporter subunit IIA [Phycisphaerales bacterium]
MKLTDILSPACIKTPLESTEKIAVIGELVDLLGQQGLLRDSEEVRNCVLERERTRSTGIGNGLAVPHGKSPACDNLVMAIGVPSQPLDFESKDGQPVNFVVLLVSPPDQTGPHIQALARVSRLMLMEKFRTALARANSAQEIYDIIARHEA